MRYVSDIPNIPVEEVKKELDSLPALFDTYLKQGIKIFKPIEGVNKIRFLPYLDFSDTYRDKKFQGILGMRVYVHAYITPAGDRYLCNKAMKGEDCPFCEIFNRYRNVSWKTAAPYSPKPRVLTWVYPLMEGMERDVYLWEAPVSIIENVLEIAYDDDERRYLPILDLENGYIVKFTMTKEDRFNKYSGLKLTKPFAIDEKLIEGKILPYDDVLQYFDYDVMKKKLDLVLSADSSSSFDSQTSFTSDDEIAEAVDPEGSAIAPPEEDDEEDIPF